MKIDKRNPRHWFYLLRASVFIVLTLPLGRLQARNKKIVVLYGHKLNGNLKAFLDYYESLKKPGFELYFLTLDPEYFRSINKHSRVLHAGNLSNMWLTSQSRVIITDHGLHILSLYKKLTKIAFVDVWHGIPFKGFVPSDLAFLKTYKEIWTTSPYMKKIYRQKLDIKDPYIAITGYGRVDSLVKGTFNKTVLKKQYRISTKYKKIILVAPTWKQDSQGRSVVPFGVTTDDFFKTLSKVATSKKSLVIFRTHLNSTNTVAAKNYPGVRFMPYGKYPIAEDFLAIADVLITDWSSIGFDYLPLKRPTIFLDVPAPFKNGFTVNPRYRFGEIVKDLMNLEKYTGEYLDHPASFVQKYKHSIKETEELIYGKTLDGQANQRYIERLNQLLGSEG